MKFKQWLILTEVKKASDIAKELLGNDINQIKSIIPTDIPEKLQSQLLPIAAYYYKQQPNINTLKQDIQDYANLVKLNKMQIITVNDDLTINNDFKSYLHWTEIIHGKKYEDKVSKAPIQGDLEGQEIIEHSPDFKIKVYLANSVNQCIILGKGESFCISRHGPHNMFQTYRDTKTSTFYFVYDNTRTDDLAIAVVDVTEHGIELTDRKNDTAKTMQDPYETTPKRIKSNPNLYFKYLQEKGIDTTVFKNIIKSPEEEAEHEKLGRSNYNFDWFKSLSPEEKSRYIGRGHDLSNEQFDYLYDNNLNLLLTQYVKTGLRVNIHQLTKIAAKKDLKDNYLHNRLIANQHSEDLAIQEYDLLNPKQKEEYYNGISDGIDKAMQFGDLPKLKEFFNKGQKLNSSSVLYAIRHGYFSIVKYLIEDKNYKVPDNANKIAVTNGHLDILKYLINEKHTNINDCEVADAVRNGHLPMIKYLVENGKEITGNSIAQARSYAIENIRKKDSFDILIYLIEKGANLERVNIADAVNAALESDNIEIAKYLVKKGATLDNYTAFIIVNYNDIDLVKEFFENEKDFGVLIHGFNTALVNNFDEIANYLKLKGTEKYTFFKNPVEYLYAIEKGDIEKLIELNPEIRRMDSHYNFITKEQEVKINKLKNSYVNKKMQ